MFERFTGSARDVVLLAQDEARALHHGHIGTEHLLLGLLRAPSGPAARTLDLLSIRLDGVRSAVRAWVGPWADVGLDDRDAEALRTIGIDLDEVRRSVEEAFGPGALERGIAPRGRRRPGAVGRMPLSPRAKKVLQLSLREARALGHDHIGSEHILLGLVRERPGTGARLLAERGATPARVQRPPRSDRPRAARPLGVTISGGPARRRPRPRVPERERRRSLSRSARPSSRWCPFGTRGRPMLPTDGTRRIREPPHAARPRHTGSWVLRTNTISWYLRSRLVLGPDALDVTTHRTILGLVPFGIRTFHVPIERLARARLTLVVRIDRVLVSVALFAAVALWDLPLLAGVPLVVAAVALLFLGIALGIRVDDRSGGRITVPVCVAQRGVARAVVRQIERAVTARAAWG